MIEIIPVQSTKILERNDNLVDCIVNSLSQRLLDYDILVVAETVVGTTEGRQVNLNNVHSLNEAHQFAIKYSLNPSLAQLILDEADLILGGLPGVVLTVKNGNLIANAGIDRSNSGGENYVTLWPENSYESARRIRTDLMEHYNLTNLGVIVSDSHVSPMRQGVIGSAIGVAGFKPVEDCVGRRDLFGYKMHYTKRAIADQVVTAAHLEMGECDEQTPFVIARGVKAEFTNELISHEKIIMPIDECLFMNLFENYINTD